MATPPTRVPLRFQTLAVPVIVPGYRLLERRLWAAVQFAQIRSGWFLERCLVDTGAPLCVIPHEIHADSSNALKWDKLNRHVPVTKYRGIDCDLGRVRIWLPDPVTLTRYGPFTLIAKFPRAPLKWPDQAVALLGLNFFDENVAGVRFRYRKTGNKGWIDFA